MPTTLEPPAARHCAKTLVVSTVKTRSAEDFARKPNDNDPFYSEANMRHLRESLAQIAAGKVVKRDIIEV